MAKYPTSAKDKKEAAQGALMHGIGNVLGYWHEHPPFDGMTAEEKAEFGRILMQQADRVAKLLGFEEAWCN